MKKKILVLFLIFLIVILFFVLWLGHINNQDRISPVKDQKEIKIDNNPAEPIFNIPATEDTNTEEPKEGPIAI